MAYLGEIMIDTEIKNRIEIDELPKDVPDYKNSKVSKEILTEQWLTNWVNELIKTKKYKQNVLLPIKSKLAYYLGVSL